jgi:hypothetical protein
MKKAENVSPSPLFIQRGLFVLRLHKEVHLEGGGAIPS